MLLTHSHTFSISLPHRALSLITSLPSPSLRTKFTCIQCHDASRRTILNLSSHSRDLSTLSQIILPNISWSNPFACLPRYVQSALLCPIGSNSGLCRSFSSLFSFLKFKIFFGFFSFSLSPFVLLDHPLFACIFRLGPEPETKHTRTRYTEG